MEAKQCLMLRAIERGLLLGCREEKGEWITVFFDMCDTGMKNMDMEFIQYMINLFKSYYPWVLNYIIVFEMPWLLNGKLSLSSHHLL